MTWRARVHNARGPYEDGEEHDGDEELDAELAHAHEGQRVDAGGGHELLVVAAQVETEITR
jgi:hypothetical protein